MENDTCWEDIANRLAFGAHVSNIDDFWCNKARSTTPDKQIFLLVCISGQAKVTDSSIPTLFLFEHNILGLKVSVDDSIFR
jgi:hypothetical protein